MKSSSRQFKEAVYTELSRIGKSLGSGARLEILDLLCQGPRTVEGIASQVGQSLANTSHHLQVLRRARLVETEKRGVHVTYRLAGEDVCALLLALMRLGASRSLEIQEVMRRFFEEPESLEPVDREALIARVRKGEATVLDVRPSEEYRAGHIPGAISIPVAQLERRLEDLPRDREIVAYCRGPYCVMAYEAVRTLRSRGFRATRLAEGVPDWRARGLPVETQSVP